jgi:superfamily II DNA helicase RecQ
VAAAVKRKRVDYREVLGESEFGVYAELRRLRKHLADRDGVPAYAVFTNEQLAEMVQRRVSSIQALGAIEGVGESRVGKYAEPFLAALLRLQAGAGLPTTTDDHEAHDGQP